MGTIFFNRRRGHRVFFDYLLQGLSCPDLAKPVLGTDRKTSVPWSGLPGSGLSGIAILPLTTFLPPVSHYHDGGHLLGAMYGGSPPPSL
jgi:hypothetical protein